MKHILRSVNCFVSSTVFEMSRLERHSVFISELAHSSAFRTHNTQLSMLMSIIIKRRYFSLEVGQDSVISVETGYGLDGSGIESR